MILRIVIVMFFVHCISYAQNYDAELVSQETSLSIDKNRLTKKRYYEIKINNRMGEKYTEISIPYSKSDRLSHIEAYIKDANGKTVKKLKKKEIIERSLISSYSLYEDNYVKEFTLKHNVYPYTIVYSYQIQQKEFLHLDYWLPIIDTRVPTLSAKLSLRVPEDYKIEYNNRGIEEPSVETVGSRKIYRWTTSYSEIIKPETQTPLALSLLPSVLLTPHEFRYEKNGSFEDWIAFGNWQYELLDGLNELPESEKLKVEELIEGIEEEREKIRVLYHYLQDETRYINVSIETGGMKPYPAGYVCDNKYGDCKALTNYFKAILDYLEIPSYYTLVHAGDRVKKIDKNFPAQQFNHAILYIPQEEEDIWLDCTSKSAFDYLGTFTQNREVLVIDYNNSYFIKTPSLEPSEVLETRKIDMTYEPEKTTAKFFNTYKGGFYETISQIERGYNASQKARIIRNHFVADGFHLKDYQLSTPARDTLEITLSYEATKQGIYKYYGEEILIENVEFSLPDFEKPENRKLPLQIDYPIHKTDTITYEIPVGYQLNIRQDSYSIQSKYGDYEFHVYEKEGKIKLIKSILLQAGDYSVSEYSDFYDFYAQVMTLENKTHVSLYKDSLHD